MDVAIISNADSPFGLSITKSMVRLGFRVYAFGEDFADFDFEHDDCLKVVFNPFDLKAALRAVEEIRDREGAINTIILNPRMDRSGHRRLIEISPTDVLDASIANFTVPLMLTRAVAEDVANLQGFFFFLTWDRPKTGPVDPILDACGEGLKHLSEGVFSVLRVLGARACRIGIQPNANRDVPVSASSDHGQTRVQAEEVADVIEAVIRSKDLNAITEIRIRPRLDRGDLRLPRTHFPIDDFEEIRLPEKGDYPPEEILIPTRKPKTYLKIAEVEFPDEEDDWAFDDEAEKSFRDPGDGAGEEKETFEDRGPEVRRPRAESPGREPPEARRGEDAEIREGVAGPDGDARRKKRRRRRRGKKNRDVVGGSGEDGTARTDVPGEDRRGEVGERQRPEREKPIDSDRPVESGRREFSESSPEKTASTASDASPANSGDDEETGEVSPPTASAKKSARKATKKTTARKAAVRKSATKKVAAKKTARKVVRKATSGSGEVVAKESGQVDQPQLVADNAKSGNNPTANRSED